MIEAKVSEITHARLGSFACVRIYDVGDRVDIVGHRGMVVTTYPRKLLGEVYLRVDGTRAEEELAEVALALYAEASK